MKYDIMIAGVGGQGTVLASRIIAAAAIESGFFTRTSETIGMSQRGGSVVSHIRIESEKSSPVIPLKKANLLIGFELSEAARSLPRLSPEGKCIVNTHTIQPVTASLGAGAYNVDEITAHIKAKASGSIFVNGYNLANEAGSVKAVNVVLLGIALAEKALPLDKSIVEKVIVENVPKRFIDLNIKALNTGYDYKK